jgi:hypothetical protein
MTRPIDQRHKLAIYQSEDGEWWVQLSSRSYANANCPKAFSAEQVARHLRRDFAKSETVIGFGTYAAFELSDF